MANERKCCQINKTLLRFYTSCALSSWGDRLWFFALSVYFIEINKNTLLINAINGFTCCAAVILFGSVIGNIVDKNQRIKVVRVSLFLQNTTVAGTCIIVICIMIFRETILSFWNGSLIYFLQGIMIFFNVISNLSSMATKICIERDWVIVISKSCSDSAEDKSEKAAKDKLANINATVRRIDLSTNVLAPIAAGIVMSFANVSIRFNGIIISAVVLATWNLISYIFEYSLLTSVYNLCPELKKEKILKEKQQKQTIWQSFKKGSILYKGWLIYFKQGIIILPSLALSMLYLTVLSFDSITIGYSKNQNLSESAISLIQALGSLTGILGTIAYPLMHNRCKLKLHVIVLIGSISQITFLTLCFLSIWMPGSPFELYKDINNQCLNITQIQHQNLVNQTSNKFTNAISFINETSQDSLNKYFKARFFLSSCQSYVSILMLLCGTALSRFGLWLFDLAIHQIIQESVDEKERGAIGGVQGSLNKIFELIKYLCVMFLPTIPKYGYLVIISFSAVTMAFLLFLVYFLIHISKKYEQIPQMDILSVNKDDGTEMKEIKQ